MGLVTLHSKILTNSNVVVGKAGEPIKFSNRADLKGIACSTAAFGAFNGGIRFFTLAGELEIDGRG